MTRFMKAWLVFTAIILISCSAAAQSAATAELHVTAKDPNGLLVKNATVTVSNPARNIQRTAVQNADGEYQFVSLPPGQYTVTVQAPGFAKTMATNVTVTVGQKAELPVTLQLAAVESVVNVTGEAELIETQRTAVASTVDQVRIDNLPINERNYLSFAQTNSQVTRDSGKPVGPAPTSGLNIGGQRGRSTLVQVDGADNTDTSVNAARSTLSQAAVQEFQVITNSYAAEYGRASGGVVNVVSKSGSNALHGDMFGFLRHRSFQAKNAFAPIPDPPFTRTQYGASLGGPLIKDKTWFFAAFEQRRRQESGFFTSDVAAGLTDSVTISGQTFGNLTKPQGDYIRGLLALPGGAGVPLAVPYAFLASGGASTALNGSNPLVVFPGLGSLTPIPAGTAVGSRFLLSGAPVPVSTVNAQGFPIAFRALSQLQKIFPVSEGTTFSSLRLDHQINSKHQLIVRGGFNPSRIRGIQVESQNQSLGQNDFSRTGVQEFHDWSGVAGLTSTLSQRLVNDVRFNYGRRAASFRSGVGDAVAVNISGAAFFGRELFSPVRRTETRYEITDNLSWSKGHHSFKFGGDFNWIDVAATFELNFAGLFNFGGLDASTLLGAPFVNAPAFTAVQQYGLGFPANYIQGFGNPASALSNKPVAFFAQDSWQIRPNLTINYGVRYDIEFTQKLNPVGVTDPYSGITLSAADILAAQNARNVQQGIRIDKNNIAPRLAIAWDPFSDRKTVIRAAYGIFYDHPLQAIAFNSDIADAAQQQQLVSLPGSPSPLAALNSTQIFQGTLCARGSVTPTPGCAALPAGTSTNGVANSADYQLGRQRFNDQTFPGFGTVLPFTLPIAKNFQYSYANQASFSVEREVTSSLSVSLGYVFVGNRHLPRPIDVNAPDMNLLVQNFTDFAGRAPLNTTEAQAFSLPLASNPAFTVVIPGLVAVKNSTGKKIVNPAAANFFRPSAPNYLLVAALTSGAVTPAVFDAAIAGSLRTPGAISPFSSMNTQLSSGSSNYNAFNAEVKKRFSRNFQFMASYTWSHTIDDSSDLQTLLLPQDNYNLKAERSNSLFDQRHRFVFSGLVSSPPGWRSRGGFTRVLADFSVAPIMEVASGRPFNILTGVDTNADQSSQTDRPSVGADGVLTLPTAFSNGTLRRNAGITTRFTSLELRITRAIPITEQLKLNVIAEGFNLFNRFNQAAASPQFTDVNAYGKRSGDSYLSRPTAAYDPRQFQFGLKLVW